MLNEHFAGAGTGQKGTIVFHAVRGVADPRVRPAMEGMFAEAGRIPGVKVLSPWSSQSAVQVSPDGRTGFATLLLDPGLDQKQLQAIGVELSRVSPHVPGLQVEIGGQALAKFSPPESEMIGLAFAIVILILAFGSVLAMGLSIAVALFGVAAGASLVAVVSNVTTVPDFATTLGAMLGIAVGIDYSLFIITRFRDNRQAGMSVEDAIVAAMDTAGRAVLFAGLTVVVSLLGMLLIGLAFVSGLGIGAAVTVTTTMVASLTLLPALVAFASDRIEVSRRRGTIAAGCVAVALLGAGLKVSVLLVGVPLAVVVVAASFVFAPLRRPIRARRVRPPQETLAYRWSRSIQRRPLLALAAGFVVLLVLAVPVFALRLGFSDEGNMPQQATARRAYDLLAAGFGPGFNGPLIVTGTTSGAAVGAVGVLHDAIVADGNVAAVSAPAVVNGAFIMQVFPRSSPQDERTVELVERLRSDVIPSALSGGGVVAFVTGATAASIDFTAYLTARLVVFIGVVLGLSFLLLMVVFRSLLVPLKAVVMNVLSIASAYGVVVAVFQWGWGSSLFGVDPAPIEPFVPMMMFAIVFGLSMDYEVFLLSRVKEEFDRTNDAEGSVADGLAATARVISAAAAIMVVVFGAFLLEDARVIKLFGVGLASAVFLDATVVRLLSVPSTMQLLGARNWWLPAWLDRRLPRLNVEGNSTVRPSAH